ncbi:hypothetical protein [Cardinium endosymbiont of Tipula unca]|uniref:hypothetical protein n=1 Tax=Cardinium endosymbiont of Tipula unca TaxID=3066216 RepID=UPI0030D10D3A
MKKNSFKIPNGEVAQHNMISGLQISFNYTDTTPPLPPKLGSSKQNGNVVTLQANTNLALGGPPLPPKPGSSKQNGNVVTLQANTNPALGGPPLPPKPSAASSTPSNFDAQKIDSKDRDPVIEEFNKMIQECEVYNKENAVVK